jgi:hypothetical protein
MVDKDVPYLPVGRCTAQRLERLNGFVWVVNKGKNTWNDNGD